MAKDYFHGKEGVWRTLPNGVHIFIPDGSDLETEMAKFTEPEWAEHYSKAEYAKQIVSHFTSADFRYHYIDNNHNRIMPAKYARRILNDVFQKRKYSDPDADALILGGFEHKVSEFNLNDRDSNWCKSIYSYSRIMISLDTRPEMLNSISHEIGHAIDYNKGNYMSSSFISPSFGVTMQDMLFREFPDIEMCNDEAEVLLDKMHAEKDLDMNAFISQASFNLVDMVQAVYGDKECKRVFGFTGHSDGYFELDKRNAGTELFAELTASLFCDKNKSFYNVIKQHCPNTIKIYHEIIEEVKSRWK